MKNPSYELKKSSLEAFPKKTTQIWSTNPQENTKILESLFKSNTEKESYDKMDISKFFDYYQILNSMNSVCPNCDNFNRKNFQEQNVECSNCNELYCSCSRVLHFGIQCSEVDFFFFFLKTYLFLFFF